MIGGTPVGEAVEEWVTGRVERRELAEITAKTYRISLELFTGSVGFSRPLAEVTAQDFERWLSNQKRVDGGRFEASTLNTRAAPVRAFFGWVQKRGIIAVDPTVTVSRSRTGHRNPRYVSESDIRRLLLVADFRTSLVLLLGLHLGLRRVEMSRLDVRSWDRASGRITVLGKNNKERTLPVRGELSEALALWVGDRTSGPMFLSQGHPGERIGPNRVGDLVKEVAKSAGVEVTTHKLRHTFAYRLVSDGVPVNVVQAFMGHESLDTTSIYTRALASDLAAYVGRERFVLPGPAVDDIGGLPSCI